MRRFGWLALALILLTLVATPTAQAEKRIARVIGNGAYVAVVFYGGHGMEMNGVNYLIPVDATIARDVDVEGEAVSSGSGNPDPRTGPPASTGDP